MARPTTAVLLTIVTAGSLTLSACGAGDPSRQSGGDASGTTGGDRVRIGVAASAMTAFIEQGKQGIDAYAKARNIDVIWNTAENQDVNTQANQMSQMINAKVDALVVVPVQANALQPQIQAAVDAKIPVVTVNTSLEDNSKLTSEVVPDDVTAGAQAAEQVVKDMGGKGNVVVLQGPLASSGEIKRTQGVKQVLAKNPNVKLLAMDTGNWNREDAASKMRNWISGFGTRINGVISQNDDMAIGAIQSLEAANVKGVPVSGVDGIEDGLNALKQGKLIGTSLQHGRVQLATGLAVAYHAVKGDVPVQKTYTYKLVPITEQNIDKYYEHVVSKSDAFLQTLPDLVDTNLKTGNVSNEG